MSSTGDAYDSVLNVQDSSSDLQLILGLNVLLVVVGGLVKWTVVDHGATLGPLGLWPNIYDVRFHGSTATCARNNVAMLQLHTC